VSNGPDLQKQYELVLQEYRFQVQLNWDRAKHFLIFNAAIFAAAVALYKNGTTPAAKVGIALLLALCAVNSFVGRQAVGQGHEMYREIRATKTKLEKALDLGDYAIVSTWGMKREHDQAPEGSPDVGKARPSITNQIRGLLLAICTFSAIGAVYAVYGAFCPAGGGDDAASSRAASTPAARAASSSGLK
jgi:hypothetical protein